MNCAKRAICHGWILTDAIPEIVKILQSQNVPATAVNVAAALVLGVMREASHDDHINAIHVLLPIVVEALQQEGS